MMRSDNRTVDHLNLVRQSLTFVQRIKDHVPQPYHGPPTKLAIDAGPLAELCGKVTPLRPSASNPKNTVQDKTVISGWSATSSSNAGDEGLKERPLGVLHQ
jgi:hypothetical protein